MIQHQYPTAPAGQPANNPVQGYPQQAYPMAPRQQSTAPYTNSYLELGKLGAVVGLCGAGAANLRRLQADRVTRGEALIDTLRTGVATGLATATAGFVANQFRGSFVSCAATLATGTAVMYILNTETIEKPLAEAPSGDQA